MKSLEEIIQSLDAQIVSNEKYYKLDDLLKYLKSSNVEALEVADYILTPYYFSKGKRMELYEYELNIVADKKQCFEKYLLDITGKKSVSDISNCIIEKQKKCYIECEKIGYTIKVEQLIEYIKFLLCNNDIQCQIKECFEFFNADNMFFEIY